jgi:hypothetical protein
VGFVGGPGGIGGEGVREAVGCVGCKLRCDDGKVARVCEGSQCIPDGYIVIFWEAFG